MKELTGVVQRVSGKKRFLEIFQDGCEKGLTSNQLTVATLEKSTAEGETYLPRIGVIPDDTFTPQKRYYHSVYVLLNFNKKNNVDRKEEEADMYLYPDEEEMEDVRLDNKRQHHLRIIFEENGGGVDNKKEILHVKWWDV